MSDDLSNFFAKKAAKKEKKKKAALVKIEDVGTALERRSHRREQVPAVRDEAPSNNGETEPQPRKPEGEESEWLDFSDSKMRLAEVGLKDMNLTEQVEEQRKEEEKEKAAAAAETFKTWNVDGSKKKKGEDDDEEEAPEPAPAQPAEPVKRAYRPPGFGTRMAPVSHRTNIDLNSQEMFPTFAAAEEIEKQKNVALKREEKGAWSTTTSSRTQTAHRPTAEAAPMITRNTFRVLDNQREVPAPSAAQGPKKGSYVPPHLRKQMQQS
ncbi:hypothetical protein QR680_013375 [Steinernema hermaphroditum]|uniref:Protein CDV3 homolog n=1 Tax=Steinernema hermaphroditum TaxID=289476 RepID=A0AA39M267_9BILA|nr:hypothetical protein QR680_013375 [Steinernema hermaphroditum]